jgi:O-antigen ligase/polysaccharide polymerase Wzy-like membrane protein
MSTSLDVLDAPETRQQREWAVWFVFWIVAIPTVIGLVLVLVLHAPSQILFVFPLALGSLAVLRKPVLGLYSLLAAALLIPVQPLGFSDSFTDNIPFFVNLSDSGSLNISGLGISPAEILIVLTFVGIIGTFNASRIQFSRGKLMTPYLVFGATVVMGELNGLVHGGDFKLSLWELRPQAYGLALFVIGTALIQERSQLKVLLGILLSSEVIIGIVGTYRYFVTLDRSVGGAIPILAHEDSYLLGLFLVTLLIGLIWLRRSWLSWLVVLAPVVLTAIIVNHRRAGLGALGLECFTVFALAYVLEPRMRSWLTRIGVVAAVVGVVFVIVFWNQQSGSIGELIRPIKSVFDPNSRDQSSDLYRMAETSNLKLTFRSSPIFGIGFGHPYYIVYPQEGVAKFDPLWNIIPHNSILWVPMRMGLIGMVTFWGLISLAIVEAISLARAARDRFLRGALVMTLAIILGVLFFGYFDLGIENYRNLIVLGIALAIINRAPDLIGGRGQSPAAKLQPAKVQDED